MVNRPKTEKTNFHLYNSSPHFTLVVYTYGKNDYISIIFSTLNLPLTPVKVSVKGDTLKVDCQNLKPRAKQYSKPHVKAKLVLFSSV